MNSFCLFASLAVFLGCLFAPVQLGSPCPPTTDIIPCICTKSGSDTIVSCTYHDPALLKLAFDQISSIGMIVDFFNVSSTRLATVKSQFFEKMTVRTAMLYGDRWSAIADDAFANQENSLATLTIKESLLTSVPVKAIGILKGLEYFAMVNSEIPKIEDNAFDSIQSATVLRTLDLRNNYIKTIGNGAFVKLTELRHLLLSGNEIRTIAAGTLPPSNIIRILDVSHNRLESVPADINTLPYESSINLNNNGITVVSGIAIRTMVTNHLDASLLNNELRCTCSMRILTSTSTKSVVGTCAYPSALSGTSLTDLQPADFSACYFLYMNSILRKTL